MLKNQAADVNTAGLDMGPIGSLDKQDITRLRNLAARLAEFAARPEEQEKAKRWFDHNSLKTQRPLVFCDPENGWNEIVRFESLECENELARGWEHWLRKEIFWAEEMRDDRVCTGVFDVPYVHSISDWGMNDTKIGGGDGGSYTWDAPIKDYSELDRLHFRTIEVDHKASDDLLELAREVFDGLLQIRRHMMWWWSLGMTWPLARLRGLEQMMLDMLDEPDNLHRVMAFLRDDNLQMLDYLEENGLLHLNNRGDYVGSGGFGWTDELPQPDFSGKVRTRDMWGFLESQETTCVSPDMFEEFVFQYQLPILERFGLNCYGCCEPLDKRWHVVRKAPRLRRVSISAWADISTVVELMQDKYILSMKPNPAHLAASYFDEGIIRDDLRRRLEISRGCCVELIMKDCHTIGNDPNRVKRWVEIALEESERISS